MNVRNRSYSSAPWSTCPARGAGRAVRARRAVRRPRPVRQGQPAALRLQLRRQPEQRIVATEDLPTGENLILSASFDKDGEDQPGVAPAILCLYYGDRKVGEGRIMTQPGYFALAGEGLCVGRDSGDAVTEDYPGERAVPFTGGTIHRVAVDVSGEPYLDLEREAAAMLARE